MSGFVQIIENWNIGENTFGHWKVRVFRENVQHSEQGSFWIVSVSHTLDGMLNKFYLLNTRVCSMLTTNEIDHYLLIIYFRCNSFD